MSNLSGENQLPGVFIEKSILAWSALAGDSVTGVILIFFELQQDRHFPSLRLYWLSCSVQPV